ncbi:MAG TPA: helix-turn-helix domain-containing protein [Pyrinomonadaceae bacterium]
MHPEHSYPTSAQLDALVLQMQKDGIPFSDAVREFKKQFIVSVMRDFNWNETKAARALRIHRNTLGRTLRELNLDARSLRKAERRVRKRIVAEERKRIIG